MLCKNRSRNDLENLAGNTATGDEQTYYVGIAISRLLTILISLCVVLGSFPINQLRAATLNAFPHVTVLRLPLDIFQGLEWVLVPGVFGVLFAEAIGLLPTWVNIFHRMHTRKSLQWGFGIVMGVALLIALIVTFYFQVFGQCVVAKAICATDTSLQIYTGAWFDVLSAIAAIISLACILVAGSVLTSVFLILAAIILFLGSLLFRFLGNSLATLGREQDSQLYSQFMPITYTVTSPGSEGLTLLPETVQSATKNSTDTKEDLMVDKKRYQVNAIFAFEGNAETSGSFSYRFLLYLLAAIQAVGALGSIVATGLVTLNTRPSEKSTFTSPASIETISPTRQEIEQALAQYDSTNRAFQSLAHLMVDRIVQMYGTFRAHGNIVVALDLLTIHDVENALREIKQRLSKHSILVVTTLPEEDQRRDERFLAATNALIALQREAIIETIILLDVRSPLAREKSEKKQEEMAALNIASLFFSHLHDVHNLTPSQALSRLGNLSPFIGMGIGSSKISVGQPKRGWRIVRWFAPSLTQKGSGDLNDAITQSKTLTRGIVEEEKTHAIATPLDLSTPFFILYVVPIRLDDPRFHEYANQMRAYLSRTYPMAQAIIVRGNGMSDPQLGEGYYVQAATLYPLAPTKFLKLDVTLTTSTSAPDGTNTSSPQSDEPVEKYNGRRWAAKLQETQQ